jgi:iron complex outermembrane receptor protein
MKTTITLRVFIISLFCILLSQSSVFAQVKRISGRVTDAAGAGLQGVSIRGKNANTGGATDAHGDYSITVPQNTGHLYFLL